MLKVPSGKLGLKQEAAGKMRVFAMVDPWSQMILAPIHHSLFKILSKHEMDGTFDQMKPLERAWGRNLPLYSMDLSSATDRLPISLQSLLLSQVFKLNQNEIEAWEDLMVGRGYLVPQSKKVVYYSVGQPMGALSSWAMLALTHHFIVQCAAWQSGVIPRSILFKDYAVLGDDIVIFNTKVAKRYHKIILSLGVECNLAKSVLSPSGVGLEFAKKTFYKGNNVSPTPLKELYMALENPTSLMSYKIKYNLSFPQIARVAGFGYKVIGYVGTGR